MPQVYAYLYRNYNVAAPSFAWLQSVSFPHGWDERTEDVYETVKTLWWSGSANSMAELRADEELLTNVWNAAVEEYARRHGEL